MILLTGKNGQVGWELQRSLMPLGDIVAVDVEEMDLTDRKAIRDMVQRVNPDIIVNPAAYTAVDRAESEPDLAMMINGTAPGVLAEEAGKINALMVHFSTDYVFDGAKESPYAETDTPNPQSSYGRSKLVGDQAVQDAGIDYLIFRTAWVFTSRANNFLLTILRLLKEREVLGIVNDQFGTPTWARLIADATVHAIRQSWAERDAGTFTSGLYNLTASGETTWYGFAENIADYARRFMPKEKIKTGRINAISTVEYPTPAFRPMNSRLSTVVFKDRFGLKLQSWEDSLVLCMAELLNKCPLPDN